jgi:hypothetical protein
MVAVGHLRSKREAPLTGSGDTRFMKCWPANARVAVR